VKDIKGKIKEALTNVELEIQRLKRQKAKLLKELYDEDEKMYRQEHGVYELDSIKGFDECALAFKCPLKWSDLEKTDYEDVRYCDVCMENVYHVFTVGDFKKRVKEKKCIAIVDEDEVLAGMPEFIRKERL